MKDLPVNFWLRNVSAAPIEELHGDLQPICGAVLFPLDFGIQISGRISEIQNNLVG
jgi:hypothetical protein